MAFRTWARIMLAAFGVGALAGASQLGLAYGLGIVRLTRLFDVTTRDQWTAQLAWATWIAMVAAVTGAFVGGRLIPRWRPAPARASDGAHDTGPNATMPPDTPEHRPTGDDAANAPSAWPATDRAEPSSHAVREPGAGAWAALGVVAGLGAAVVVPLTMQPARTAQVAGVDPVVVIAVSAGLGALVGASAGFAALAHPVARRGIGVMVAAVWAIAIVSVVPSLGLTDPLPAVRLGVFDAGFLSPATTQRTALFTMPALGLLTGAALGWAARREDRTPQTVALAGLPGPLLLTVAYLVAGPGSGGQRYQLVPYWAAMAATVAGVVGSVLAAMLRRNDNADPMQEGAAAVGGDQPMITANADRPPLPRRRTGSAEPADGPTADVDAGLADAALPVSATGSRLETGLPESSPPASSTPAWEPPASSPPAWELPASGPASARPVPAGTPVAERSGAEPSGPMQPVADRSDLSGARRPADQRSGGNRPTPVELHDAPTPMPFDGFTPADTGSLRRDHLPTAVDALGGLRSAQNRRNEGPRDADRPDGNREGPVRADQRGLDQLRADPRGTEQRGTEQGGTEQGGIGERGTDMSDSVQSGKDRSGADRRRAGQLRADRHRDEDRRREQARPDAGRHGARARDAADPVVPFVPRPVTSPYIPSHPADPTPAAPAAPVSSAAPAGGVLGRGLQQFGFGRKSRRADPNVGPSVPEPATRSIPEPPGRATPEPITRARPEPATRATPEPATRATAEPADAPRAEPPSENPYFASTRPARGADTPSPARQPILGPARHPIPEPARHQNPEPARHPIPEPARHPIPEPPAVGPFVPVPRPERGHAPEPISAAQRREPFPEPPRTTPVTRPQPTRIGSASPAPEQISAALAEPIPTATATPGNAPDDRWPRPVGARPQRAEDAPDEGWPVPAHGTPQSADRTPQPTAGTPKRATAPADPPSEAPSGRRASRKAPLRPQDEEYVDWVSGLGSD